MDPTPLMRVPAPDPSLEFAFLGKKPRCMIGVSELPDATLAVSLGVLRLDPTHHSALELQLRNGAAEDSQELAELYWNDSHTISLARELIEHRRFKMPIIVEMRSGSQELIVRDGHYRVVAARRALNETGNPTFSTLPALIASEPLDARARGEWIVRSLVQAKPTLDEYETARIMLELHSECGMASFEIGDMLRLSAEDVERRIDSAEILEELTSLAVARKEFRLMAFKETLARRTSLD